jgi:hypothetical protein
MLWSLAGHPRNDVHGELRAMAPAAVQTDIATSVAMPMTANRTARATDIVVSLCLVNPRPDPGT